MSWGENGIKGRAGKEGLGTHDMVVALCSGSIVWKASEIWRHKCNLGLNGWKIKLGMVWIEHGRSVTIDVIYLVPFYSTRLIDIQSTWRSQPSGCSIQKMIYCKNRMDWNGILTHVWASADYRYKDRPPVTQR